MNDAFSLVPDAPEHAFDPLDRDYAGFIFDCDGTLADSMPLHFKAWRTAFSTYGAPFDFTWELFLQRAGKTLEVTVDELNVEFNTRLDRDAVTRIQRETYRKLLPKVGPVRPVLDFVRSIAGHYPMAVASGSDRSSVTTTLASLAILDLFSVIVTGDDVVHGKPAPDMFLLAAERLAVPSDHCVVFEDSLLGIEAAERAGMESVLVRRLLPPPI
jgi:HAD superfamily hydrolase (TIGR01509 family)